MNFIAEVGSERFELTLERRDGLYQAECDGRTYTVERLAGQNGRTLLALNGRRIDVILDGSPNSTRSCLVNGKSADVAVHLPAVLALKKHARSVTDSAAETQVAAPMPGLVLDVLVDAGDDVKSGQPLLLIEAMKMENEIRANRDGTIRTLHVKKGDPVEKGAVLLDFA